MILDLEQYCVHASATMMDAIGVIQNNNSRCVVVLNEHQKVIGMFSEGDVLRAILAGTDVYTPINSLIKPSFYYLRSHDIKAARNLILSGITVIPVINDHHHLESVITIKDIFGDINV